MACVACPDGCFASQVRIPCGEVFDDKQLLQGIDVVGHSIFIQCAGIVGKHVFTKTGIRDLLGDIPSIRTKEQPCTLRTSFHPIHALYVSLCHRVHIVESLIKGNVLGNQCRPWPSAPAGKVGNVINIKGTLLNFWRLDIEQVLQTNRARRLARFIQTHGTHHDMCESPCATMYCLIGIGKYRRPCKDKLRGLPSPVHFATYGIPDGRQRLPFVNQARSLSFQKRLGTYLYHLCALFQHRCLP